MKLKVQPRGGVVSTNAWCLRGLPQVIWKESEVRFKYDYQLTYSSKQKRTKLVMLCLAVLAPLSWSIMPGKKDIPTG